MIKRLLFIQRVVTYMPELPEVETVKNGLAPLMEGAVITAVQQNRPNLRFPFPENFDTRLHGATVQQLTRRAKYLLGYLTTGDVLVMHLGMSGRFVIDASRLKNNKNGQDNFQNPGVFIHHNSMTSQHDHVVFSLNNGAVIRYNDTRRFGFMMLIEQDHLDAHKLFQTLGVEPLSASFTPDYLAEKAHQKTTTLKAFLLNQKIIAGLGNIYVCEALFQAGLKPTRRASCLATRGGAPNKHTHRLVEAIKNVLHSAIEAGGSTLRDHRQADGSLGYFQHQFQVYGRDGQSCLKPGCDGEVRRLVQNGRSSFYCHRCQT